MEIQKVNFTDLECYDDCENGGGGSKIWTKIIGLALYLSPPKLRGKGVAECHPRGGAFWRN